MSTGIHPTAIIDTSAIIGADVSIGPYAIVEGDTEIGDGCEIRAHAVIGSGARLGRRVRVFPGACVGLIPQDLKFAGETTCLFVGDDTTIRECATLNRGTRASGKTVVGRNCLFMAYSHVGHDCVLGDGVICANSVALAGHVVIGNNVRMGGAVMVHQFSRIGDYSIVGIASIVNRDIVPFAMVGAEPTRIVGVNKIGLERQGFSDERRQNIARMYRIFFRQGLGREDALARIAETYPGDPDAALFISFVKASERTIMRMGDET